MQLCFSASDSGGGAGSAVAPSFAVPPWLLRGKVLVPQLPQSYVSRPSLLERLDGVLDRRLTVLRAPAGFGKTTVLADVARGLRQRGVLAAWVSLDGDDTPNLFGSYLAAAFQHAGLDLTLLDPQDVWSSSAAVRQLGMLARAIELHGAPCLLVLDEVDRLPRRTLELIDLLVKHAPDDLHLAVAGRSDPRLELASQLVAGDAAIVGPPHFRFSRADIARFFQGGLSRRELVAVEERTAGWPAALLVYRNLHARESPGLDVDPATLADNYVGVSVLRDLSAEERASLLDLAVFDWIDEDLTRAVLGSTDALARVVALPALDGLLLPIGGDRTVRRLHPLLRDYCLNLLLRENPGRRRSLHKRLASALAERGHLTPAWRHAAEADDTRLLGRLIERFGAYELWLREGVTRLISAARFLTEDVIRLYPRLGFLRCINLCLSSKFDEARALFEALARATDGFSRDRDGRDPHALMLDRWFTQGFLSGGADHLRLAEIESLLPRDDPGIGRDDSGRLLVSGRHVLLCFACYERARFEQCREHGLRAQSLCTPPDRFGHLCVNIYLGMSAMAQGLVGEAIDWYARAQRDTRDFFSSDPCIAVSIDVLTIELDLERDRERAIQGRALRSLTELRGVWIDVYATAVAVSAELTAVQYGGTAAVLLLEKSVEHARATGMPSLFNFLSALLAYYLVEADRSAEADAVWRDHELPCDLPALLDLELQSWHTMEALSCARIRLLAAQSATDAAEELANGLCAVATDRGLKRTLLRGVALSVLVAESGGRSDRALARLVDFLRLTREVDYVRPLVRQRAVTRTVLRRLLGADGHDDVRPAAESMLDRLEESSPPTASVFSARELEVLAGIREGLRNKEIATRLGMTDEGVRYHLRNIYRKTGASKRRDVARYAESMGAEF